MRRLLMLPEPGFLGEAWEVSGSVSLRPEPFGAMAYDFKTRRLSFIKSLSLLAVVERLADAATVGEALTSAGIHADQQPRHLRALEELARSGILTPRPAHEPVHDSVLDSVHDRGREPAGATR